MSQDLDAVTKLFGRLGADDPESWSRSQVDEGTPQLHRFLFLSQAWKLVVTEEDESWIDRSVERCKTGPKDLYAGGGRALERMLALGVAKSDIVDLVRAMQAEMLFGFCYMLEDPGLDGSEHEGLEDIGWALVSTDPGFSPTSDQITGLHASVLEIDPTGREWRPR